MPRWKYRLVLNADGNFNWEQMAESETQKANDVSLHDGEVFMVESSAFRDHCELRKDDVMPVSSSVLNGYSKFTGPLLEIGLQQP